MPTAYEQGLELLKQDIAAIQTSEGEDDYSFLYSGDYTPRYGQQLEAHGDVSEGGFFSGMLDIALAAPEAIANAPKFAVGALVSGTAQLYNSGIELANWAGADLEHADVEDILAVADDDLATYYRDNQEAVDLVGFVAGSIVPGSIGVKGLNMFQSSAFMTSAIHGGKYGKGMSKALGLLAPNRQKHLAKAIHDVTTTDTVFKLGNANMVGALRAGLGQSVLEVAAAETMTYAMMNASPILEGQDFGDFVQNVAFTSLAFGTIGGAIRGASDFYSVKKVGKLAEWEAAPWTHKTAYTGVSGSENISLGLQQINEIPKVTDDVVEDLTAKYLGAAGDDTLKELGSLDTATKRKEYLQDRATKKVVSIQQDIRKELTNLADGDQAQADAMFNSIFRLDDETAYATRVGKTVGLQEVGSVTTPMKTEARLEALASKLKNGKDLTTEEFDEYLNLNIGYQRNHTFESGAPTFSDQAPILTTLADVADEIKVDAKGWKITAGEYSYKFSPQLNDFDMIAASPFETNARYIAARETAPFSQWRGVSEIRIKDTDIPFLEKVLDNFEDAVAAEVKIITKEGEVFPVQDMMGEATRKWLSQQKRVVADMLQKAGPDAAGDATAVANRLRGIVSFPFTIATPKSINAAGLHSFIGKELASSNALANKVVDINRTTEGFRRISINANDLTSKPMQDLVSTLKHEEGHDIFTNILQNGGIPKELKPAIKKEMEAISRKMRESNWGIVDELEKARAAGKTLTEKEIGIIDYMHSEHALAADTFSYFSQWFKQGEEIAPTFAKEFGHKVNRIPDEVVSEYAARVGKLTEQEIAAKVNATTDYLKGGAGATDEAAFAMQKAAKDYSNDLRKMGRLSETADDIDIWRVPQYTKLAYDSTKFADMNDFTVQAMNYFKEQNKVYMQGVRNAADSVLGSLAASLPDELVIDTTKADRFGAGAGFITFANGNYGSLASAAEFMGRLSTQVKTRFKDAAEEALNAPLHALSQNPKAAVEFSVLNARLRAIPEEYILDVQGSVFRHAATAKWEKAVAEAQEALTQVTRATDDATAIKKAQKQLDKALGSKPVIATKDAPLDIPIENEATLRVVQTHIELNGKRVNSYAKIRQAQGQGYNRNPDVYYPTPVEPKDYPYFAIVVDDTVTAGWGNHSTLYATSADELEAMTAEVKRGNPKLRVHTAKDAEDYYKSIGQWQEEKSLTDNYFDVTQKRKGVSAPFAPATDPDKITDDLLNWHLSKESGLVNETMLARYEDKFEELRMLGEAHTNFQTSKFSSVRKMKHLEDVVDNPFTDYIRTALGMTNNSKYPLWTSMNRQIDEAISKAGRSISSAVHRAKSVDELDEIGRNLEAAGYPGAKYTADMEIFANAEMPRGLLESFVRKANSILSTITLRLDSIQAVNNAVSSNILVGAEAKAVIRAIEAGDDYAVGKLTELAKAKIPGSQYHVLSPSKLIANSYKRYFKVLGGDAQGEELRKFYKDNGFITSISDQYKWSLDQLSFTGKETAKQYDGALKVVHDSLVKAADKGEKWTGNLLAEEMNRFVSADVMKQLTDLAIESGKMNKREALTYINTFVSRTQGNYLAAQRPGLFKGAIGQSIGLFQTYQFNLIQQLLRHVGEGTAKDAMTLLALQGSIHGMNGLPAFSAVNQHLVGTASGNANHRDLYDAAYSVAGKEAGDWLLYGAGSNFLGLVHPDLKFNLYTRGDINPRHLTIIPNSVNTVPWVNAYGKFLTNFIETGKKLAQGGDPTSTLLQGIEHNGLSRPLAGMAQSLEAMHNPRMLAYSTTKQGNVSASNDFWSLATAVRIAGAKPLDDAIALDTVYRLQAYGLKDSKKIQLLGEAFKTKVIAGEQPQREELLGFMERYMEYGGNQENFSKWARQLYKSANLSQANKFAEDLDSWESQHMQKIMAGEIPDDFYDVTPEDDLF